MDELRGNDVGKDFKALAVGVFSASHDGGRGLVAGAFDAEDEAGLHALQSVEDRV